MPIFHILSNANMPVQIFILTKTSTTGQPSSQAKGTKSTSFLTRNEVNLVPLAVRNTVDLVPLAVRNEVDSVPLAVRNEVDLVPLAVRNEVDSVPLAVRNEVDLVPLACEDVSQPAV